MIKKLLLRLSVVCIALCALTDAKAQSINWAKDGNSYYQIASGEIISVTLPKSDRKTIISRALLTPA
jgi:dipeptidyl-peptidase-4